MQFIKLQKQTKSLNRLYDNIFFRNYKGNSSKNYNFANFLSFQK